MKKISRRNFLSSTFASLAGLGLAGLGAAGAHLLNSPSSSAVSSETGKREQKSFLDCDYVIRGGYLLDGSGSSGFWGDLAIKGERIAAVGSVKETSPAAVIDARGLIVTPGFIDVHSHIENYLLARGRAEMLLLQGVTSHLGGNCGSSPACVADYLERLGSIGVNIGLLAGYRPLRQQIMGGSQEKAGSGDIEAMQRELSRQMKEGVFGFSVGLEYWPQMLATTEELIELCLPVAEAGGFYAVHLRCESNRVEESLEEALLIGRKANIPVQYSHIKAAREPNWGKMKNLLFLLEEASRSGQDVKADVYAYTFSGWDVGSSVNSIAKEDMLLALRHPLVMVGSDAWADSAGKASHPRTFGNFARILGRYVREQQIITLSQAVYKMTGMPAARMGLSDRGLLLPGCKADVCVFSLEHIKDRATRNDTSRLAQGVEHVFVNGSPAVKDGKPTGILAGTPLIKGK